MIEMAKNINVYLVMNTQAHAVSPSSKFCSSQLIAIAVFGRWSGVIYLAAAFLVVAAFFLAGAFLAAGFFGEAFLAGLFLAGLFAFLAGLLAGEGGEPGSSFTGSKVDGAALGSALVSLAFFALGAAAFLGLAAALVADFLAGDFAGFRAPETFLAGEAFLAGLFLGDLGADGEPGPDGLAGEADRLVAFLGAAFLAGEADLFAAAFLAGAFLATVKLNQNKYISESGTT